MEKLWILFCTHDRREKTKAFLDDLPAALPEGLIPCLVAVDAGSTDGTEQLLRTYKLPGGKLKLLKRDKSLYWNAAMRVAMQYTYRHCGIRDYVCLMNDDVRLFPGALAKMLRRLTEEHADAVVGSMQDEKARMSYGGVRCESRRLARFSLIEPSREPKLCDCFNCNCLLLSAECFLAGGNLDKAYTHSMGDYDYGLRLSRAGRHVINSAEYAGICADNAREGGWRDTGLPRLRRLRLKESPKGLPLADWFHFVRKHYGLAAALYHSVTPYIRILIKR